MSLLRYTCILLMAMLAMRCQGERFSFNMNDPVAPYVENESGQRYLRFLQAANPCQPLGSRIRCDFSTILRDSNGTEVILQGNFNCEFDSQIQADFRRMQGCICSVNVVRNGSSKRCECTLCPAGFGDSPAAVDCDNNDRDPEEDPFIINRCSSLDCSLGCNGTCNLGCVDPIPPECLELCGTRPPVPTTEPTAKAPSSPSGGTSMRVTTGILAAFSLSLMAIM